MATTMDERVALNGMKVGDECYYVSGNMGYQGGLGDIKIAKGHIIAINPDGSLVALGLGRGFSKRPVYDFTAPRDESTERFCLLTTKYGKRPIFSTPEAAVAAVRRGSDVYILAKRNQLESDVRNAAALEDHVLSLIGEV